MSKVSLLYDALRRGDPDEVNAFISRGADIRYRREHGYDALIDAVHGRDLFRDNRLIELLKLLIDKGVELSNMTEYCESGLRVLSRLGRFDAVQLLLDAGADRAQLEWTPLMQAVATGSLLDVQAVLSGNVDLEARDWWGRTAWLIALQMGDIAKAELLLTRGACLNARGRCATPSLFYAIRSRQPATVRWLLKAGADVKDADEFGNTALMEAVEEDNLEMVDLLIDAGADIHADHLGTAAKRASSRSVILRLLDAGCNPADINQRVLIGLNGEAQECLAKVTPREFRLAAKPIFGNRNPQCMNFRFWEEMIRCGAGAYQAKRFYKVEGNEALEPVWCADRFGQSFTMLPDGRIIQIAGEHEDYYDPDFCIYNDVIVHHPDQSIEIFGYPESDFPPTDFHTATLMGRHIYIIGSVGYMNARQYGYTPVYRLDTTSMKIERVTTTGDWPGCIFKHRAQATSSTEITIWDGEIFTGPGKSGKTENKHRFTLNVKRLAWQRISAMQSE